MLIEGAYLSLIHTFVAKFTGIYETSSWSNALVKSRCVIAAYHSVIYWTTIAACFYSTLWIYSWVDYLTIPGRCFFLLCCRASSGNSSPKIGPFLSTASAMFSRGNTPTLLARLWGCVPHHIPCSAAKSRVVLFLRLLSPTTQLFLKTEMAMTGIVSWFSIF